MPKDTVQELAIRSLLEEDRRFHTASQGIDFKPPQSVADAAAKGLEYRQKASPSNKGGLTPSQAKEEGVGSGVSRATTLKNRQNVSPETIEKMVGFFSRHEKNKGVSPEHKQEPWNDKGHVAWLLWGGDPGKAWAEKVWKQMKTQKQARSNAKVVEIPNTFHQVVLEPPKETRSEFPFEGFIDFQGLEIDVENAKGSTRSGTGPEGDWSTFMNAHYGEIRGTEGTDGDKLDVYVGDNHDSSLVVVIHQYNPWDGTYDEDKVVLGCDSVEEAIGLFKSQYDRPGFYREGEHTVLPIGAFWRWVHEKNNQGKRIKMAKTANVDKLPWTSVTLDLQTVKDAIWLKWSTTGPGGTLGYMYARRMPNGWQTQFVKSLGTYNPNAPIKSRPKSDADILKASKTRLGGPVQIVKNPEASKAQMDATPAPKNKPGTFTVDDVTSALKSMRTQVGGRNSDVYYDLESDGTHYWSAHPQNRQRLDHFEGRNYDRKWRGDDDDDWDSQGWDVEGWNEEYVRPLYDEVQNKLDERFGKGVLSVGIGEKGHIEVILTPKGTPMLRKATMRITKAEVLKRFKDYGWQKDRDFPQYMRRKASFYTVTIWQYKHTGTKEDHFDVVWYRGSSSSERGYQYRDAMTLKTLDAAIAMANKVKPQSDEIGARELGESPEGKLASVQGPLHALSSLLAFLRAVQWNHLTSHWQSQGSASYGDHLLFQRLYEAMTDEVDTLAEKVVGLVGSQAVDQQKQAELMGSITATLSNIPEPFERALLAEKALQDCLKNTFKVLESQGQLTLGVDDYLAATASTHEAHIYLLQQRLKPSVDVTTRVATRHFLNRLA